MKRLRKLPRERLNDVIDAVQHVAQRADYWKSRYGLTSIAERYLIWGLVFHLHLHPRKSTDALCVTFRSAVEVPGKSRRDARVEYETGDEHDDVVLVGVVELMQEPEGIEPLPIPTRVRLEPLDLCPVAQQEVRIAAAAEARLIAGVVHALRAVDVDREVSPFLLTERISTLRFFQDGELTRELVERRPQFVAEVTDQYGPGIREDGLGSVVTLGWLELVEAGFRIRLTDLGGTDLAIEESLALELQQAEVFTCES